MILLSEIWHFLKNHPFIGHLNICTVIVQRPYSLSIHQEGLKCLKISNFITFLFYKSLIFEVLPATVQEPITANNTLRNCNLNLINMLPIKYTIIFYSVHLHLYPHVHAHLIHHQWTHCTSHASI